jgi:hypothetical protein
MEIIKTLHLSFRLVIAAMIFFCTNPVSSQKSPAVKETDQLRFRKFTYIDQQGTGIEAFSFLMPSDWQFEGGMTWLLDNPMMPSVSAFRVFNPKGREEFEVFPNHSFYWTTSLQQLSLFPPGSRYFGSVVKQPITAQKALRDIILPEQRRGSQGLTVLKDENVPELPLALGAGKQAQGFGSSGATGAKLRIRYNKNGVPMDEEFYAVVETITFPIQSMYGTVYNTLWYIDYTFSFKAEAGKLENSAQIFQVITSSIKLNPRWYAKYSNVIEYLAQQQITHIRNIGEFSRMLAQTSDQIREEKMEQFKANGEVYDRVAQKFSDNTLGIDRYFDPHEAKEVELPSGYDHAWCNNNGEYILTDNPNFNPNVGSNLHWEPMNKNQ